MEYSQIIPEEYQHELIQMGEKTTEFCFRIGDITNSLIGFNRAAGNDVTNQNIYAGVAMFAGRKSRTIRDYAEVSAFYPMVVRQMYAQLKFDHFRFAKQYKNWQDILEYAMSHMDLYGRPSTIDALISHFAYPEPENQPGDKLSSLVEDLRRELYTIPMAGEIRSIIMGALDKIKDVLEQIKTPV